MIKLTKKTIQVLSFRDVKGYEHDVDILNIKRLEREIFPNLEIDSFYLYKYGNDSSVEISKEVFNEIVELLKHELS